MSTNQTAFAIVCGLTAVCAVLVGLHPLNFLADDALFYLVIADHVAAGAGSTLNGLFPTNGYHPLWLGIASLLAQIPHTRYTLLELGVAVQCACWIATLWIVCRSLRTLLGRPAIAACLGVMLALLIPMGNLYWTEAPLTLLFLALLLAETLRPQRPRYVRLGMWLGLLFLSRLDTIFLIFCFVAALWYRDRDRRLALACAICACFAIPYVAGNLLWFGHAVPISGAIKSSFYRHTFFSGQLDASGTVSLVGAAGLAVLNLRPAAQSGRLRIALLALSSGVLLHAAYIFVLTFGDTMWPWYYAPGYLCLALLVAQLVQRFPAVLVLPTGPAIFAVCVSAALLIAALKFIFNSSLHDPAASAGNWRNRWLETVQQTVPDDGSVLVVFDQTGLFAFGTAHPVFALDGLTSNYDFDMALARQGMYAQLKRFGVAYLVAPKVPAGSRLRAAVSTQTGVPSGQIVHFSTPLRDADAGCISIDNAGLVATMRAPQALEGGTWGVWKLTAQTLQPAACLPGDLPSRTTEYYIRSD